ncbi:MAG: hypothetical protein H0X47_02070, partial [Nitrospirales bacterium]|nr:hypothetical protein [Nitrospirales bacterium]
CSGSGGWVGWSTTVILVHAEPVGPPTSERPRPGDGVGCRRRAWLRWCGECSAVQRDAAVTVLPRQRGNCYADCWGAIRSIGWI